MQTIHKISGYIATLYLIHYHKNNNLLLLDSGCSCDVKIVKNYIETILQLKMENLKLVCISHAHPDHSGGASYYKKKYGVPIAGNPSLNYWYKGFSGFITYIIDIMLTYLVAKKKKKGFANIYFPRKVELDILLSDNMPLPNFNDWLTLLTPGHTDSDLTFFNKDLSVAYIGDKIISAPPAYFRPYPISKPDEYKKSLQKFIDLKISTFLLAHNGERKIPDKLFSTLINSTPSSPRVHKSDLFRILSGILNPFK